LIGEALQLLTDELNSFLERKEPRYRNAQVVVLSDLVNQQGELVITIGDSSPRNNIIVTLINVEEETIGKAQLPHVRNPDRSIELTNPEIKLNLYVLFSAFSSMTDVQRYANCLHLISYVVRFFQSKSVFNHQNTPSLSPTIEKLIVELVSPTFEQQNYLWGALGAKYMPSVLYKVRMLTIREVEEAIPSSLIDEIQVNQTYQP
jgi:hypothetical protein